MGRMLHLVKDRKREMEQEGIHMFYGYCGKIVRVNLTSGKITVEDLPESLAKQYLGAKGFGTKILYDEVPAHTEPLSPENKIAFA
jgi:aldehyde:ferredoxin oxidoreductase